MRPLLVATLIAAVPVLGAAHAVGTDGEEMAAVIAASDPGFVALDEIATPIFGQSRIEGVLSARLVLQAQDIDAAIAIRSDPSRIRATALTTMIEYGRLNASPYTPVDAGTLSTALSGAIKAQDHRIARVLIVRVMARNG